MNSFLLMVRDFIKENPQLSEKESNDLIYKLLTNYGVYRDDLSRDFTDDGTFNRLLYFFKDRPHLRSFISSKNNYFCQFVNDKNQFKDTAEAIKIYVPQDANHLEYSAKLIFDFLDRNDFCHVSKIARRVRFDNIVIRMKDKNEATQLLNFVQNNNYIQEGLIKPNPFAFNHNNIAMACDRNMSYNCTVSSLINLYMKNLKDNNALDRASIEDYVKFVTVYYRYHFVNYNDIGDTITDFDIEGATYNDLQSNEKIVNVRDIIELHLKTMEPSYSIENFFSDYNERLNKDVIITKADKIRKERNKSNQIPSNDLDEYDLLLFNTIDQLKKKYDNGPDYPYKILQKYIDTGIQEYITRDNNLRQTLVQKDFARKMKEKLNYESCNVQEYYYKKLLDFNSHVLDSVIYETYKKYQELYERHDIDVDGFSWIRLAILSYIEGNDATGFTRQNNVRKDLVNFLTPNIVYNMVIDQNNQIISNEEDLIIAIDEYIKNVIMNRFSLSNKQKVA